MNTLSEEYKFRSKYSVDESTGCWVWKGKLCHGYGRFCIDKTIRRAHRASYEIHIGAIPDGMMIDHRCFNRACVNPNHLRAVTMKQNQEHRQGAQANNHSSGVRGVYWDRKNHQWKVQIKHNQRCAWGGRFDNKSDAIAVATRMRQELFTHDDGVIGHANPDCPQHGYTDTARVADTTTRKDTTP